MSFEIDLCQYVLIQAKDKDAGAKSGLKWENSDVLYDERLTKINIKEILVFWVSWCLV